MLAVARDRAPAPAHVWMQDWAMQMGAANRLDELAGAAVAVGGGHDVAPRRHQGQQHGCGAVHAAAGQQAVVRALQRLRPPPDLLTTPPATPARPLALPAPSVLQDVLKVWQSQDPCD